MHGIGGGQEITEDDIIIKGQVDVFANLPAAGTVTDQIWMVENSSGVWLINRKSAGPYYSDGRTWLAAPDVINAFHKDVAGEINALTNKAIPVGNDLFLIEDSANSNNKKKSTLTNAISKETNVAANTVHRTSDGKNHSDVVLNTTHRGSDGKNHADVVTNTSNIAANVTAIGLNTTHRGSDGKDHSDVGLNNTHRTSDGSDHSDVFLLDASRNATKFPFTSTDGLVQKALQSFYAFRYDDGLGVDGLGMYFNASTGFLQTLAAVGVPVFEYAVVGQNVFRFGNTGINANTSMNFLTLSSNNGLFSWIAGSDYFQFNDDILIQNGEKLYLRDSAIGVYSQANTFLDLFADGAIRIGDSAGGVPTNYANFAPDGELTLAGTAKVKIVDSFTFNFARITGQGAPTLVSRGVFFGFSLPVYNNDDEELFACKCLPPDWDGSSDLTIYIGGWLDTANTGKKFNLQVSVEKCDMSNNEVVPTSTHDYPVETDTGTAAQYKSFKIAFTLDTSAIAASVGDALAIRVRRIPATVNEIAGEFVVEGMAIEYTADKLGGAT